MFDALPLKILLVEKNDILSAHLSRIIVRNWFNVDRVENFLHAERIVSIDEYDMLILSSSIGSENSVNLAKFVRASSQKLMPVIFICESEFEKNFYKNLFSESSRFLIKPVDQVQFINSIRSLFRVKGSQKFKKRMLIYKNIAIDLPSYKIIISNSYMRASPIEYKIMCFFLIHPREKLNRERIMDYVWKYNTKIKYRTLDSHINRIRKLLSKFQNENSAKINTIRCVGYILE